jgi:hypothetical protein
VLGQEIETVMQIFYTNFAVGKDPEVRLSFFALLSKLLSEVRGKTPNSRTVSQKINLVEHSSSSSQHVRVHAIDRCPFMLL